MPHRVLIAALLLSALRLHGDSWSLPKPETVHSANGQWRLTTIPKQLKGQLEYFTDKVAGATDAGAAEGIRHNEARGELYHKTGGGTWRRVARWQLVNEVSPASALVTNGGTVVTFDNWHSLGYGDDVIVIYRSDGSLVRKLGLADLMQAEDISQLQRSVSSISWSGTHRVDEDKRVLMVEINAYRLETVPISLENGSVLGPKRIMFPRPRVTWTAEDIAGANCDGAIALLATELESRTLAAEPPDYPSVARKARIAGTVIVDIWVDQTGAVHRAEILKPLPFGLDRAAHDAIVQWRFRPIERDGQALSMCGRVNVKYDLTSMPPGE